MSAEHISRIINMLEEGKISAAEAQTLIAALGVESKQPSPSQPSPSANPGARPRPAVGEAPRPEPSSSKSFEFGWSKSKSALGLDLSALGKQITDAVKRIDPDRILRDARAGGKRWQDRVRHWAGHWNGDETPPANVLGQPTAQHTEVIEIEVAEFGTLQLENDFGSIHVTGGAAKVSIRADMEAWAGTAEKAAELLRDVRLVSETQAPEAAKPARSSVRVSAPEEFRDGIVALVIEAPDSIALLIATLFGDVSVEKSSARVEVRTASGAVTLNDLGGEARAESMSGEMRAVNIRGALALSTKSGDVHATNVQKGASLATVSGEVRLHGAEGAKVEARSVSGDVLLERIGLLAPIDITVESVSGDVRVSEAVGNLALKTVSGDATAIGLKATTVQGQVVSGDIRIELSAAFVGTLTTNTVSGDVIVALPPDSNFRFALDTQSGELHSEHSGADDNKTERLWTGSVGTGAGTVNVHTLSGDVRLTKGD